MNIQLNQRTWLNSLRPGAAQELFDYLPDTLYFAKDNELRLMAGNRAFVDRCGFCEESELMGRTDQEIFPPEMAEKFAADDREVIRTGKPLTGIVELFPDRLGDPAWFITDKIPLHYRQGGVAGVCGIVRSFEGARCSLQPYLDLLPVTEFLRQNYMGEIVVADLAHRAGMSVRKLQRRFKETFKTTIQAYVGKLRVLEACGLLATTDLTITEIAFRVGFYDHAAFSKKFSEIIGAPPRTYRRRISNSKGTA